MAENHLSGAQVAAIENKIRDAIQGAIKDVELRKWAVEHALTPADFELVYKFISQPANVTVKIEQ